MTVAGYLRGYIGQHVRHYQTRRSEGTFSPRKQSCCNL